MEQLFVKIYESVVIPWILSRFLSTGTPLNYLSLMNC